MNFSGDFNHNVLFCGKCNHIFEEKKIFLLNNY